MKSFRYWYRTDDTPQWKRAAFRFLLAASIAVVLVLLAWWFWAGGA